MKSFKGLLSLRPYNFGGKTLNLFWFLSTWWDKTFKMIIFCPP